MTEGRTEGTESESGIQRDGWDGEYERSPRGGDVRVSAVFVERNSTFVQGSPQKGPTWCAFLTP